MTMAKKHISRKAEFWANSQLQDALTVVSEADRHVAYKQGWSDDLIARRASELFNEDITKTHIATLRTSVFGILKPPARELPQLPVTGRVERLERLLNALCSQLGVSVETLV